MTIMQTVAGCGTCYQQGPTVETNGSLILYCSSYQSAVLLSAITFFKASTRIGKPRTRGAKAKGGPEQA